MPKKTRAPKEVLEFLRKAAAKGGKARAKNLTAEERSAIGKLGGRPKGKKKAVKKGKTDGSV